MPIVAKFVGEAVVSGDDLKGTPISVDFSLPVSTEILDMLAMGQPDSEVKNDVVTVQVITHIVFISSCYSYLID